MNGNVEQVNTPDAPGLSSGSPESGAPPPPPTPASDGGRYRAELLLAAGDRALGRYEQALEHEAAAEETRVMFGLEPEPARIPALEDCRFSVADTARLRALVTRALVRIGDDVAFTTTGDDLAVCTAMFGRVWLAAPRRIRAVLVEGHLRAWARSAGVGWSVAPIHITGRVTKAVRRRAGRVLRAVRRSLWRAAALPDYTWVAKIPGIGEALPRAMAGATWSTRAWCCGLGLGLPFQPKAIFTAFGLVNEMALIKLAHEMASAYGHCDRVPQWAVYVVGEWVKSFGPRSAGVYQQLFAAAGVRV